MKKRTIGAIALASYLVGEYDFPKDHFVSNDEVVAYADVIGGPEKDLVVRTNPTSISGKSALGIYDGSKLMEEQDGFRTTQFGATRLYPEITHYWGDMINPLVYANAVDEKTSLITVAQHSDGLAFPEVNYTVSRKLK